MNLPQMIDRAAALHRSGQLAEAEQIYRQVLQWDARNYPAHYLLGVLRRQQNRHEEALVLLSQALRLDPKPLPGYFHHASALLALNRPAEALVSIDKALKLDANNAEMHYLRAASLMALNRPRDTLESLNRVIRLKPQMLDALMKRACLLQELGETAPALSGYDAVLALNPKIAEAHLGRAQCLQDLSRAGEALAAVEQALALAPRDAGALHTRGSILRELGRPRHARASFEQALAVNPAHPHALSHAAEAIFAACNWPDEAAVTQKLVAAIHSGSGIIEPFLLLATEADAATQLECARRYAGSRTPATEPLWKGEVYHHDKIRLAYLSCDFRDHPVAQQAAGLFERHDRSRFELHAISFGPEDASPMRRRLEKAFDHFHDVTSMPPADVAALLRKLEVDIAVDLAGYTAGGRPQILFHRPCPVQVNFLGYPGSMGSESMDYVIADPVTLPFAHQPFFTEKIVHLPGSYLVNDDSRPVPAPPSSRVQMGLPENGFVFCCFNNNWKITESFFDVWMRLLAATPGSVLWLRQDNPDARAALEAAANARGIDPQRLVFAARVSLSEHLARHAHADLFLDTLPYGAHATASDALWMGLPVITCRGAGFQGRVAAGLLTAAGLSELVTENLADYESLAVRLAAEPALLKSIRERLVRGRGAIFDTGLFCRQLEAAYVTMWERRGEAPQSFSVNPPWNG